LESSRYIPKKSVLFFAFAVHAIANQPQWPIEQSRPRESRRIVEDALAVGCNLIGLYAVVPSFAEDELKALALASKAGPFAKFCAD
jgi:hypothetical protein